MRPILVRTLALAVFVSAVYVSGARAATAVARKPACEACAAVPQTGDVSTTHDFKGHKEKREWFILVPGVQTPLGYRYDNCVQMTLPGQVSTWGHSQADMILMSPPSAQHPDDDTIVFTNVGDVDWVVTFAAWLFREPAPADKSIRIAAHDCSKPYHIRSGLGHTYTMFGDHARPVPAKAPRGAQRPPGVEKLNQVGPAVGADG